MSEPTFTAEEAMAVRRRMRKELGMGEEHLPASDLARMIGDELEKMNDTERAARIVSEVTGKEIDPKTLTPPKG